MIKTALSPGTLASAAMKGFAKATGRYDPRLAASLMSKAKPRIRAAAKSAIGLAKKAEEAYEFGFADELEKMAKVNPKGLIFKLKGLLKRPFVGKAPALGTKRFTRMGIPGELTPARMGKYRAAMRKTDVASIKAMRTPVSELPPFLAKGRTRPL